MPSWGDAFFGGVPLFAYRREWRVGTSGGFRCPTARPVHRHTPTLPKSVEKKSGVKSEVTYSNDKGFSVSRKGKKLPVKFKSLSFKEHGDKCKDCPDSEKFLTYTKDNFEGYGLKVSENKVKDQLQRTYVSFDDKVPNLPDEGGIVPFDSAKFPFSQCPRKFSENITGTIPSTDG